MNDDLRYIELAGRKYPLCFTLEALEAIGDRFGDIANLGDIADKGTADQARDINDLLRILIRCGRKYVEGRGEDPGEDLPCEPKSLIPVMRLREVFAQAMGVINGDSKRTVEATPPKN